GGRGGRVPDKFGKVVGGVPAMPGAAADAEQEQAPAPLAQLGECHRKALDRLMIDGAGDLARLIEKGFNVTHAGFLRGFPIRGRSWRPGAWSNGWSGPLERDVFGFAHHHALAFGGA